MALTDKDRTLIGMESGPMYAPDEVCKQMIRHWVEYTEDENPLYTDEEYARGSKYGGIIAPPQMMMVWCMPRMWPWPEMPWNPMGELELPGATTWVATDIIHEFILPVRPGDTLSYTMNLKSVSEEKKTRVGTGHFITTVSTYRNQRGEVVGTETRTVLKFAPAA